MAKKNITVLKFETLVDLKISGAYYARIQDLLLYITTTGDKETIIKASENLKNKVEPTNALEYNLETLLILINEIELQAKEQGKFDQQEIDLPDDDADTDDSKTTFTKTPV